jgi:hypothetical protein
LQDGHVGRRKFLGRASGLAVAAIHAGSEAGFGATVEGPYDFARAREHEAPGGPRAVQAERIRRDAAAQQRKRPAAHHATNGDEERYDRRIGSFGKGLPHNTLGEVDPEAFAALTRAMRSGKPSDFDALPVLGTTRLRNPQAALAFDLQGPDSHALPLNPPPAFASAETAAEMVELYWQALTRDVSFSDYAADPLIAEACAELSSLVDFRGPKVVDGTRTAPATVTVTGTPTVTPTTLFRADTAGDLIGPYISQFLQRDIPFGAMTVSQRINACAPGVDHMTVFPEWLSCQNGGAPGIPAFDEQPRYLRSGRDLCEYVHRDYTYQPYMNAALILFGLRAPFDASNPYKTSFTQEANATFGPPAILDLVARIPIHAAKAAWYHKWSVHRRLRPEEYGGRVHNHKAGDARYPLHAQVLDAAAVARILAKRKSCLLPMAYPEGCPVHPAYPAGHAVVAGACVTMLKAFFDESWAMPRPVVAARDGLSLVPWSGAPLTVGNELNKLAGNIAMGRGAAGVHWRSDGRGGLALGEAIALDYLAEMRVLWNEQFDGFSVTRFDGTPVTV